MEETVGADFQEQTKYARELMHRDSSSRREAPSGRKDYPDAPSFDLPRVEAPPDASLHDTLAHRRSIRDYDAWAVPIEQLSYLLWASNGIKAVQGGYAFRTAPSAGALYPIETYVIVNNVEGLPRGLYHYSVYDHGLRQLNAADLRNEITAAALGQQMCADAPVVFVWTAVFGRSTWRYGQRAYRYIYLDAGHIAENLALAAVALDLGTCQIGALFDDEVNHILGVDGDAESVVYMSVVGKPVV
jgi:SagB-type dehydrogenase family enzyme